MTELPQLVIEKDHRLQKATDELAQLRWHWTLDETNPKRVPQREYARQVGVDQKRINVDANAWADHLAAQGEALHGLTPGTPHTVSDFRELRKLSSERQEAAKAIAKATGQAVSSVTTHKKEEIADVVNTARERAIDRGTTVESEIDQAAEWREKARRAARREQDERKAAHTMRYVTIEGQIGVAMQKLRAILNESEGVEFTEEEKELLVDSLAKLRALLNLIDMRIAGNTNVDWDAELHKLVK